MAPINLLDQNMQLLSKVLDLRATKAQVISSNIANAETPGFSPSRFQFEDELANAIGHKKGVQLATSHEAHLPLGPSNFNSVTGKITIEEEQSGIGDDNNVSVDQEMLALSENELLYETSAQLLKKKITILKYVIAGGQ
ncbi:flagellar basal body rod protein FlgB [Desulforhopalus sp. IMCC35007]|uniref:flagellar basal body rod protein FlgB n=1 Tax=Desulforhopalus sp. IMCC35007 TaxID=2569543 RepID=UPI0010AE1931|nr:flagellar basal body rod protein FlgB [Desulforhopalus sp. IMCC35007]TKB10299.1 flagellar basal body rod protein FlgB [Desulforhopalus sp. IMCC35007]